MRSYIHTNTHTYAHVQGSHIQTNTQAHCNSNSQTRLNTHRPKGTYRNTRIRLRINTVNLTQVYIPGYPVDSELTL